MGGWGVGRWWWVGGWVVSFRLTELTNAKLQFHMCFCDIDSIFQIFDQRNLEHLSARDFSILPTSKVRFFLSEIYNNLLISRLQFS